MVCTKIITYLVSGVRSPSNLRSPPYFCNFIFVLFIHHNEYILPLLTMSFILSCPVPFCLYYTYLLPLQRF